MSGKSWRLLVTALGGSAPLSEAHVEAGNWMTALTLARKSIGETGGVPPGASCSVAPDGKVTIHDAVARKTYLLSPLSGSTRPPAMSKSQPPPKIPADTVPRTSPSQPPGAMKVPKPSDRPPAQSGVGLAAPENKKKKVSTSTIAYDVKDLGLDLPVPSALPSEIPPSRTVAYDTKQQPAAAQPMAVQSAAAQPMAQAAPEPEPSTSKKKKKAMSTVAFDVSELGLPPPPDAAPAPEPQKKIPQQTVAFEAMPIPPPEAPKQAEEPKKAEEPAKKKKVPQTTVAFDVSELGIDKLVAAQQAAKPASSPPPAAPATKSRPPQTIAYDTRELGAAQAKPSEPAPAKPKSRPPQTIAYDARELGLMPPASAPATNPPASVPSTNPPAAPELDRQTIPDEFPAKVAPSWELLFARDEEPSKETPLLYRERTYYVPPETSDAECDEILAARFGELRTELASRPKGKLVNMAIFDHRFAERPMRPPVLTLQWKDWRGDPVITKGPARTPAPMPIPPVVAAPPPFVASLIEPEPAPPPPSDGEGDDLDLTITDHVIEASVARSLSTASDSLSIAFESLQDLFFLSTPIEGLEFVVHLLEDLVPSEAVSACIYDINTDEFRFVALTGPGAEERQGDAVPRLLGLLGAAATAPGEALLVDHVAHDRRFDPGVDGRVGIDPATMALAAVSFQGRLLGMLQLINRTGKATYEHADANVLHYVADKLGEFLQNVRMRPDERRQA